MHKHDDVVIDNLSMKSDCMTQCPTLSTNDLTRLHCAVHGVLLRVPIMWAQVSHLGLSSAPSSSADARCLCVSPDTY